MLAESRETIRQDIHLEEVNGTFRLQADDKSYDSTVIRDVSVTGVGIQLDEPLAVGTMVEMTFSAGDWKIAVEGRVVWCSVAVARGELGSRPTEAYRMGIKFNPHNANNNVIFFMASRSMVNPHI
jgi:hypothetical protein